MRRQDSQITVQTHDYLFTKHSEYSTQYSFEEGSEPDLELCLPETVAEALENGKLTADQALWLHQNRIDWQISVER